MTVAVGCQWRTAFVQIAHAHLRFVSLAHLKDSLGLKLLPWVILQDLFHKQYPVQALPSQWQSRLRWAPTLALAFSPLEPQDSAILLALMAVNISRTRATGHGRHLRSGRCVYIQTGLITVVMRIDIM